MDSPTQKFTSQEHREREEILAERRLEQSQTKPLATNNSPDFLKFVPCNERAKRAFSELIDRKKEKKLGEHHAQYLVENGRGPLSKIIVSQARSEGETTDEDFPDEPEPQEINLGCFRVNFDCPSIRRGTDWVIGRGSERKTTGNKADRNVDIMLAVPGSRFTQNLLAAHAYLRMHPDSGVWMIYAAPESSNRSRSSSPRATVMLDDKEIFDKEFRCLAKPEARLTILDMEYSVQFPLETYEATKAYRKTRDTTLRALDIAVPDTNISGIPLNSDIRAGYLAVFSTGLGSGGFATVYEAFDPQSGDLRAVKVIEVKGESAARSIETEIQMAINFGNARGLVRQYGWRNSNGDATLDFSIFPLKVYLVQEKGQGFHKHDWQKASEIKKLKLCEDLLHGLVAIHAAGWMHRDISRQNILYFKGEPPRAALCDFGKLYPGKTDTNTVLAAWVYLPPEIVEGGFYYYNQSIDVWMLALALVGVWYPEALHGVERRHNGQIRPAGIMRIRIRLQRVKDSGLAGLLNEMLAEKVGDRPTARQALDYPCFRNLEVQAAKIAKLANEKRRQPEDEVGEASHT